MNAEAVQHVLVVDNNRQVLAELARELEDLGYDPVTTWSGVEALHLLQSASFGTLLVADYLPDMYVGHFLERVLHLPTVPRIWIMQDGPARNVCTYEAGPFEVVDKRKAVQALRQLNANQGCKRGHFWVAGSPFGRRNDVSETVCRHDRRHAGVP
jgi:CheY-like chemotaxis protein